MSDRVDIHVPGKAPIRLPIIYTHDPKTKRRTGLVVASRTLTPGPNRMRRKDWEAVTDHPAVKNWLRHGALKTDASPAEKRAAAPQADRLRGLKDLTVAAAAPHIAESSDRTELERWRAADSRKGIAELIDDRLDELDGDAD